MKKDLERRLLFAKAIARAAGEALLAIRDANLPRHEEGDQLKSAADLAAQALLTTMLAQHYPGEAIIAEDAGILNGVKNGSPERSRGATRQRAAMAQTTAGRTRSGTDEGTPATEDATARSGGADDRAPATEDNDENDLSVLKKNKPCWIVDPLDGTRSYHDGFDGFCVQLAYGEKGVVQVGVVYQPVTRVMYSAIRGGGAFREQGKKKVRLPLHIARRTKIYIDSRPAKGAAREILDALGIKKFLECGSFGIKLCKVAEGSADMFVKDAAFKLWDVAPAEVIFHETKNKMTLWNGKEVRYDGSMLGGENLFAAPRREHRAIRRMIDATIRHCGGTQRR